MSHVYTLPVASASVWESMLTKEWANNGRFLICLSNPDVEVGRGPSNCIAKVTTDLEGLRKLAMEISQGRLANTLD